MILKFIVLSFLLFLISCAQKPTKVFELDQAQRQHLARPGLGEKITIDENTIVLDVRAPFNYSMAHIRRSMNLSWTEFSKKKRPFKGLLSDDLFFHARRLARAGISPDSKVVVVGQGLGGKGEEGRLAWTLYHMGIKNVQYASIEMFRHGWTNHVTERPYESVATWKPDLVPSVLLSKKDFIRILGGKPGSYFRKERTLSRKKNFKKGYAVLDVRMASEYRDGIDIGALNVPWKEFFDINGRPKKEMVKKLKRAGLKKSDRIAVISNQGVRSAAVTMALLDLGFLGAGNYAGGFSELLN